MNWGKWIVLSFVLFAVFIGVLVAVCLRQEVNLVSGDYYRQELAYQEQIDRMTNANRLESKPTIRIQGTNLEVEFTGFKDLNTGEIKLFRPSDSRLDKVFVLLPSHEPLRQFDVSTLPKGRYLAKMKWSMAGKEFYVETDLTL